MRLPFSPPALRGAGLLPVLLAAACTLPDEPGPTRAARAAAAAAAPDEAQAAAVSATIRARHLPYGTVVDPVYLSGDPASPGYAVVDHYSRGGDAAIWTGHYLAAEAVRYRVTGAAAARENALLALRGIARLVKVTGDEGLLARFYMPTSAPARHLEVMSAEEARHGRYPSADGAYYWWGNTSRDQYSGVFFGLGVAHEMLAGDEAVRAEIREVVRPLLDFLLRNGWNVRMPDGTISTTFLHRPDQRLSFLQVGRRVDPARYDAAYRAARSGLAFAVSLPIQAECGDPHGSYYKFNLDYVNLYNLARLEEPLSPYRVLYLGAYNTLRGCTGGHGNAHFNMIDRGLKGAGAARDAQTRDLLAQWLQRPRRDYPVDLRAKYPACGENRACDPVPAGERPNTDFLWQRSPFLLVGGGEGTIETAGIDYLLPYWLARYHGVLAS